MYSMMTVVSSTVFNNQICESCWESNLKVSDKQRKCSVTMCGDGCSLNSPWGPLHNIQRHPTMLHTEPHRSCPPRGPQASETQSIMLPLLVLGFFPKLHFHPSLTSCFQQNIHKRHKREEWLAQGYTSLLSVTGLWANSHWVILRLLWKYDAQYYVSFFLTQKTSFYSKWNQDVCSLCNLYNYPLLTKFWLDNNIFSYDDIFVGLCPCQKRSCVHPKLTGVL